MLRSACQTINTFIPRLFPKQQITRNIGILCNVQQYFLNTNNPLRIGNGESTSIGRNLLEARTPQVNLTCGLKIKGRLKLRCKSCYFIRRDERWYVYCPAHGRHKQAEMKKRRDKKWIITFACQNKKYPWY